MMHTMTDLQEAYLQRADMAVAIGALGLIIVIALLAVIAVNGFRS